MIKSLNVKTVSFDIFSLNNIEWYKCFFFNGTTRGIQYLTEHDYYKLLVISRKTDNINFHSPPHSHSFLLFKLISHLWNSDVLPNPLFSSFTPLLMLLLLPLYTSPSSLFSLFFFNSPLSASFFLACSSSSLSRSASFLILYARKRSGQPCAARQV